MDGWLTLMLEMTDQGEVPETSKGYIWVWNITKIFLQVSDFLACCTYTKENTPLMDNYKISQDEIGIGVSLSL